MICHKCKHPIPEKALKCNHCGTKIATLCKKCRAYNSIYNLNCANCNAELLKICPSCKCVNLPEAKNCRKCGHDFTEKPDDEESQLKKKALRLNYDANYYSQQMAKEALVKGVSSNEKRIISLSGQKGIGKSVVLKSAINELKDYEITWLLGECTPITQLSPCGLIQDILLTFFNVTNFCSDSLKLKKDSQRFFQNEFPTLTNEEIFNLLNFLYPSNTDNFENIVINKQKTFTLLEKVFKTILDNHQTILIIDNFDLIDGMSYEFLDKLLEANFASNTFKFLLTYNETRPARGYLYHPKLKDKAYLDISLNTFDKNQVGKFIEQSLPAQTSLSGVVKAQLIEYSGGVPAVIEQFVNYLNDYNNKNKTYNTKLPHSFNELIKMRLYFLKQDNPAAFAVLAAAAIQGLKFYPVTINQIFNFNEEEFLSILTQLQKLGFIMPSNDYSYIFKNTVLWDGVLDAVKTDENFTTINEKLYDVMSNYTLSSNSMMAVIAQNLNQKSNALKIWTENTKLASYIGDTNLYAISQKQSLVLVDEIEGINSSLIKNNIYERLGKLLSKSNPREAIEYLPNAISNAKKLNNTLTEIELTGYLANCCISLGDYYSTVECIDSVINKVDSSYELELAMLKSRKLDALLNIGNSGQIVNLVDNEIMPIFEKYLDSRSHKNISIKTLYGAWLKTYLILANALVFQGNNRSFEVLATLFDIFQKNHFDDQLFICKAKLALAFANTMKGDIEESEKILEDTIKVYKTDIMDNEAISRWNLINILNNFTHKKYSGLKEELFQVVTFANNVNDNFTKNILKTLLGKIFKDEENAKHALDIFNEQITYFAKEKNAIGALLCWYLIAQANLVIDGPEKSLEVSIKALDVAQSPKINSYVFIVMFNKIIAEAYMAKSDYESAKIHLEKAILVAKKFELLDLLGKLYLMYGKYLQDIALVKSETQVDYVLGASKMYKKASLIAQAVKNEYLSDKVEKSKTVLNSFCQLNGIILK